WRGHWAKLTLWPRGEGGGLQHRYPWVRIPPASLSRRQAELKQFPGGIGPSAGPISDLAAASVHTGGETAGQHIPAGVAMVACGTRQSVRIAREDFVADGGQTLAEDLADVGMTASAADDLLDGVRVDVADR